MSTYIDIFDNNEDILREYTAPSDALDDAIVYLAWYSYEYYSGSSLVIFEKNGTLYEVNGSHCSCYGLEGQWEPEETSWEALAIRDYSQVDNEVDRTLQKLIKEHLNDAGC